MIVIYFLVHIVHPYTVLFSNSNRVCKIVIIYANSVIDEGIVSIAFWEIVQNESIKQCNTTK